MTALEFAALSARYKQLRKSHRWKEAASVLRQIQRGVLNELRRKR